VEEADDVLVELELQLEMELIEIDDVGTALVVVVVIVIVLGLMLDDEGNEKDVLGVEEGTMMPEVVGV
jgi:hypothetical protein